MLSRFQPVNLWLMYTYILYPLVLSPSPSPCPSRRGAAAAGPPGQQEAGSRVCRDPTEAGCGTGWCGSGGNAASRGSGSPHGPGS